MSAKNYQYKDTNYTFSGGKWVFVVTGKHELRTVKYELRLAIKGKETARKVAGIFNGAIARKGYLDAMGRGAIEKVIKMAEKAPELAE